MAARGIGRGDRIGIRMPSGSYALYVAILATLATGAAYVPVDADDPDERAALVFGEANVVAVITEKGLVRSSGSSRGWRAASPLGRDDAWIIFTSGSTGTPKGVAVTHHSAAAFVDAEAQMFLQDNPIGPGDRVLAGLSVAFDASCEEMWLAWRHGACLVPAPRSLVRSGMDLGPWLVSRDITVVSTVPTLAALWPAEALEAVRLLIFGGEACPPDLAERLAVEGREVWNTYGPTEATVVACAARLDGTGPVSIGLPLAGWDLAVVDKEGQPVPFGEVGELVIGGVGLARYLDPEKDAEKYAPMPTLEWSRAYRSGDLVRLEPDGLYFMGRADDQVKVGGRRIELGEVDAALVNLPGVSGGAAAVRRTASGTPLLVGYIVLQLPRRPLVRPDEGARDAGSHAARRAGTPAGAPGGVANQDLGQGGPQRAAVARRRRRGRRVGRPRRDHGLAGRAVARRAGRAGRRTRSRLPCAWRRIAVRGTTRGRNATALSPGGRRGFVRPSPPRLACRVPRRTRPAAQGRDPRRQADAEARPDRSGGPFVAAGHVDRHAVGGVAGALLNNVVASLRLVPWAVTVGWWWVVGGFALFVSPLGRMGIAVLGARLLLSGVEPGTYRRGGSVHLRVWAAERLSEASGAENMAGAPWLVYYARALGNKVGKGVDLHSSPPVTGLAKLGHRCSIEPEVDLSGHWIDGDHFHLGRITVGNDATIGARTTLLPGAVVGKNADVAPGSGVVGKVKNSQYWKGSPAVKSGKARHPWPDHRPPRASVLGRRLRRDVRAARRVAAGGAGRRSCGDRVGYPRRGVADRRDRVRDAVDSSGDAGRGARSTRC